jgi:oligosaccharide repeat unit polymerase
MIELALFITLSLVCVNYAIRRDYAYPPFIFSVTWLTVLLAYYILKSMELSDIYALSNKTLLVFVAGVVFFSIGGMINYFEFGNKTGRKGINLNIEDVEVNRLVDNILFLLPFLLLPFFINKAITIASHSGLENFFVGLRTQLTLRKEDYGILKYAGSLSLFNVFFRVMLREIKNEKEDNFRYYISLAVAFTYAILSTGRTSILLLFTLLLGTKLIRGRIYLRHVVYFALSFLAFFFLFAVMLGKGGSLNASLTENVAGVSAVFTRYLISPLSAFDVFLKSHGDPHFGEYGFRFLYAVLYKIGITDTPPIDLVQPFIYVPFPTNVYTIYYTYAKDFGVAGSLLFVGFFGFIHSFFYFKAKADDRSLLYSYLYVLFVYPLIMSFFQDQYFSLISLWLQFILFFVLFFAFGVKIARNTGEYGSRTFRYSNR